MSHPDPHHDPENVRTDDHPRAPKASAKKQAVAKKMKAGKGFNPFSKSIAQQIDDLRPRKESPYATLKRLLDK